MNEFDELVVGLGRVVFAVVVVSVIGFVIAALGTLDMLRSLLTMGSH